MTTANSAPDLLLRAATIAIAGRTLLDSVSLEVARGERVALIGPSGAGKTTLLRLCAAVLWPTAGEVQVLQQRTGQLHGRALYRLRQQVGLLYQHDNLVPGLRAAHNVLMGRLGRWSLLRSLWSLFWPQEVELARAALRRVELADRLWALPGELSGGEQQRVAIARLLVQQPRVLLADEPASALDIRLGRAVVDLLLDLAREHGTTLLLSLHTLDLLGAGFDRVVALQQGRIVWQGQPSQLTRSTLRDVYGSEYRTLHLDDLTLDGATP